MSHSTSDILPTKTITYKTVDELEIQLDVYVPNQADKVPVLLWYHGGGLLLVWDELLHWRLSSNLDI